MRKEAQKWDIGTGSPGQDGLPLEQVGPSSIQREPSDRQGHGE